MWKKSSFLRVNKTVSVFNGLKVTNFKKKNSCMEMNYNYPTTIFRSIFAQMYKFLVEKYMFTFFAYELFKVKIKNSK